MIVHNSTEFKTWGELKCFAGECFVGMMGGISMLYLIGEGGLCTVEFNGQPIPRIVVQGNMKSTDRIPFLFWCDADLKIHPKRNPVFPGDHE